MTDSAEDTANFLIPPMPVGTYSVQVVVNGIASNSYALTLSCSTVGLSAITEEDNSIRIYPNPGTGIFIAEMNDQQHEETTIEVYNLLGEKIFNKKLTDGRNSLDLSSESEGFYLYRTYSNSGKLTGTGKLVIQR